MDEEKIFRGIMKVLSAVVSVMILTHLSMMVVKFFAVMGAEGHEFEHIFFIIQSLILLELFYVTITYFYLDKIEPGMIILVVLTALGREIIVTDIFSHEVDSLKLLTVGILFLITIIGLKMVPCGIVASKSAGAGSGTSEEEQDDNKEVLKKCS